MVTILECFPLEKPRQSQVEVLKAIEAAFIKGYKNVLLEAPVGSGKSAIAVACGKFYGEAHILTPRKSLQDQYHDDFHKESLCTMKGRSAYPCTYPSEDNAAEHHQVTSKIRAGKVIFMSPSTPTCAEAPCLLSNETARKCRQPVVIPGTIPQEYEDTYPCPYHSAIDTAQNKNLIVHNLHSFIFQTYYGGRFKKRELLVVDECHEVEGILRGFAEKKVVLPLCLKDDEMPVSGQYTTMSEWAGFFNSFADKFSTRARNSGQTQKEEFLELLLNMESISEIVGTKFVTSIERDTVAKRSRFTFTPEYVGNLVDKYISNYGEKRLFMSGTIYSKDLYCRLTGLKPEETCFIKIGSSFPKANRPIYLKPDYIVDTSHKMWDTNFLEMITKIKKIMAIFPEDKGLIHAPSYHTGLTLMNALKSTRRVVTHDKDSFQGDLLKFYASPEPLVFLSPICQQGVDFKGDRSRFQIILRVPYPSTADAFMEKKVKEDFPYYNYQALITFGQQIGRVNRSEDDFGATILMDERFTKFILRNNGTLPKWLTEAIIYK
jgi:ATP-dependent DNA helicase DinG